MSCDVCIGVDLSGEERAVFSRESIPVARKVHECYECRLPILVGQRYALTAGKWDGEIRSYKQCLMCREIQQVFSCGEGWYFGGLWEEMEEAAFDQLTTASECFRELSPASKAFVLERWRKWKGIA